MEFIISVLAVIVIVLLYRLQKQLILIYDKLPNLIKNDNQEKTDKNEEIVSEENDVYVEHNNRYDKKRDYIDNLARWVEENKDNDADGEVMCYAKCNKLSCFSLWCDVEDSDNTETQIEKNVVDIKKKYYLSFEGIMESYYGVLPSTENVCDLVFTIIFEENIKKRFFNVSIGQDAYDNYESYEHYEGKHTVLLEVYEDISELEKYKTLLLMRKNLGADVRFVIDTKKIKMNENKIDKGSVSHIGTLSNFHIFILDK